MIRSAVACLFAPPVPGSLLRCSGARKDCAARFLGISGLGTMVKRGYGAGLGYAAAFCLATCLPRNAQAFVFSSAVVASRGANPSAVSRGGGAIVRARAERTRTIKGLGVAAGGSAVESASTMSTDDGEGMRVAQIQGFTDKVSEAYIAVKCELKQLRNTILESIIRVAALLRCCRLSVGEIVWFVACACVCPACCFAFVVALCLLSLFYRSCCCSCRKYGTSHSISDT